METNEFITLLVSFIIGAAISMLSTYLYNVHLYKSDKIRFEQKEKLESDKQIFGSKKNINNLRTF